MVNGRYFVSYIEDQMAWVVFELEAGMARGHPLNVPVCSCHMKQEALLVRDALESFPYTAMDYMTTGVS